MKMLVMVAAAAAGVGCSLAPCGVQAAYVDGVYWVNQDLCYVSATVHNDEPEDWWEIGDVIIVPEALAISAWGPDHWPCWIADGWVRWRPDDKEYRLQPGGVLSGFGFSLASEDYSPPFRYILPHGGGQGYFTPTLIPEPGWGAGIIALMSAFALRGRRRRR